MRGITPNGDAVRELRKAKGWSQEAFADACGCTTRTVRNAERGQRVDAATLTRFAEALGAPVASLIADGAEDGSAERNLEVARQWVDAFMAADTDRLMPLHHPEAVVELPGTEDLPAESGAGDYRGFDGVRRHYEGVFSFFEPLRVHEETYDANDQFVFHRSRMSGKNRQTGYVITARYFNEFEFEGGLIKRRVSISDLTEHRRSFGAEQGGAGDAGTC